MTASWCDPHSVLRCHKPSQNYISLCLGAVAKLGWAWEPGHVAAPVPHWIPWHKVGGSTITGPSGQLDRGTPLSCFLHGVTPRYPGMLCCQGTGKHLLRKAGLCGKPWVSRGTGEPWVLWHRKVQWPENSS